MNKLKKVFIYFEQLCLFVYSKRFDWLKYWTYRSIQAFDDQKV